MREETTALLIIRAWTEPGSLRPLRAHIQATSDVSVGFEQTTNLSDLAAVRARVDEWLSAIASE